MDAGRRGTVAFHESVYTHGERGVWGGGGVSLLSGSSGMSCTPETWGAELMLTV